VVLLLLGYLASQGSMYNQRQALEMYTFRRALELSREQERGIDLTVIRDVPVPSFFTALNRQRLISSASVDCNPWKVYIPDVPQDVGSKRYLQIGEKMIRVGAGGAYIEVPPTKVKVVTNQNKDKADDAELWQWVPSAVKEIDPQDIDKADFFLNENKDKGKESGYSYNTTISENSTKKTIAKDLATEEEKDIPITFEGEEQIKESYLKDDWSGSNDDDHIRSVEVDNSTIPKTITFKVKETVERDKKVVTPHYSK
jgi:hypothetical protein